MCKRAIGRQGDDKALNKTDKIAVSGGEYIYKIGGNAQKRHKKRKNEKSY